jgi:DNA replication and repair protein RecF
LKSVLLSWKMAESRFLESRSGHQPVLLLDDVFSELDETRSRQLLLLADDFEQVVLTTPRVPSQGMPSRFEHIELSS